MRGEKPPGDFLDKLPEAKELGSRLRGNDYGGVGMARMAGGREDD